MNTKATDAQRFASMQGTGNFLHTLRLAITIGIFHIFGAHDEFTTCVAFQIFRKLTSSIRCGAGVGVASG